MAFAAAAARFLQPIRASVTSPSHPFLSHIRFPIYKKLEQTKAWMKYLQPALHRDCRNIHWFCPYFQNLCKSGWKLNVSILLGVSIAVGSSSHWPLISYSMDGIDVLEDDRSLDFLDASDSEEDLHFLTIARKLWLPISLLLTVLINWGDPTILVAQVVLFLFCTKPSPLSVYLYVEQLRRRFMRQQRFFYAFKPLYAKKVEVDDYKLLCMARVEIKDEKFTLIGILGGWWVLSVSPIQKCFL